MRKSHNQGTRDMPHQHRGVGNSDLEFFRPSEEADEEHTHTPAVNPVSEIVAEVRNKRRFPGKKNMDFGSRLYSDAKQWRRKSVEQLKKEQDAKEMAECTFTPTERSRRTFVETIGYDIEMTKPHDEEAESSEGGDNNSDGGTRSNAGRSSSRNIASSSNVDTPDRLVRWKKNKDQRIRKMQDSQFEKVIKDCTFQPNLEASRKGFERSKQKAKSKANGPPVNTLRRSIKAKQSEDERSERARYMFYERQRRALQESGKRKTSLSPQTSFHTHPDLTSRAPSVDVMTNDPEFIVNEGGGSELLTDPVITGDKNATRPSVEHVEKHLQMARARSIALKHSQLENQLCNRWRGHREQIRPDFYQCRTVHVPRHTVRAWPRAANRCQITQQEVVPKQGVAQASHA